MAGSVPWLRISSMFQLEPVTSTMRPPEMWSTLATAFAVTIGSRWTIWQMPVPSLIFVVAAAAIVSATKRSSVRS